MYALSPNMTDNFSGNDTARAAAVISLKNKSLATAAIAGITVGIAVTLFFISLLLYFILLPILCIVGPNDPSRQEQISSSKENSQNDNTDEIPMETVNDKIFEDNKEGIITENDVSILI